MQNFSAPKKVKRLKRILIFSAIILVITVIGYSFRLFGFNVPTWKNFAAITGLTDDEIQIDSAKFWFLNVGQGNCSVIVLDELCIMIDCGPEDSFDDVASFMIFNGIEDVDYLIVTHPHNDHIGGA